MFRFHFLKANQFQYVIKMINTDLCDRPHCSLMDGDIVNCILVNYDQVAFQSVLNICFCFT